MTLALIACSASLAQAQRGQGLGEQATFSAPRPSAGFPGLFDTELANRHSVVGNLPWLSVQFGLTENLTIGTHPLYIAPLFGLNPSFLLTARYRVYGTANVQSTMDMMVGGLSINATAKDDEEIQLGSTVGLFATNTLFVLSKHHHLTLNAIGGTLAFSVRADKTQIELSATGFVAGATYSFIPANWFSLSLTFLPLSYLVGRADSTSSLIEIDLTDNPLALDRFVYRAGASFRAGSWLFDLGAVGGGVGIPLPWLNVAFKIGGS